MKEFRRQREGFDLDVRGARDSNHPLPLAPLSRFKSGTFSVAEKRKFLFCVDTSNPFFCTKVAVPRLVGYQHPGAVVAATGLLDTTFAATRLLKATLK
jgi:hypothetical protein